MIDIKLSILIMKCIIAVTTLIIKTDLHQQRIV